MQLQLHNEGSMTTTEVSIDDRLTKYNLDSLIVVEIEQAATYRWDLAVTVLSIFGGPSHGFLRLVGTIVFILYSQRNLSAGDGSRARLNFVSTLEQNLSKDRDVSSLLVHRRNTGIM